eukprot:CAMPEP_0175883848 /NCGR_PEP_ID=MMETSP0107_2-20121207/44201_1 /TAXON_ID=195067 ORGANISM="Goniomonas pacifica, Strain CCMP1869" /NCGR_SAMPLE_ID=MMETSP0107_2 /ASSEMBLY_ACC=CAM_ASM_000203 /LENGTH=184 /DNA_ID=CAMNT_0017203949 /DNA_START=394 /DNA_END=945 /DNA_ORIENTATION=+
MIQLSQGLKNTFLGHQSCSQKAAAATRQSSVAMLRSMPVHSHDPALMSQVQRSQRRTALQRLAQSSCALPIRTGKKTRSNMDDLKAFEPQYNVHISAGMAGKCIDQLSKQRGQVSINTSVFKLLPPRDPLKDILHHIDREVVEPQCRLISSLLPLRRHCSSSTAVKTADQAHWRAGSFQRRQFP